MARLPHVAQWRNGVRDSDLDGTAVLVALVLSTFAKADGTCYPGKERLARDSRLSKRAVDNAVLRLEAAGFLSISRSRGGRHVTNGYHLTLQGDAPFVNGNPAGDDTKPCRGLHPKALKALKALRMMQPR